jgi:hypothetical protein
MCVYVPDKKLAFIHIPKTAGISVRAWMNTAFQNCQNYETEQTFHDSIHRARKYLDIENYFSVVRNPWARAISFYNYFKNAGPEIWKINNVSAENFPSFEELTMRNNKEWIESSGAVMDFKADTNQVEWIDKDCVIVKMEDITYDLKKVCKLFDINERWVNYLPRLNSTTSENFDYRVYYNERTKNAVAKMFERDIDTFGYTF